MRSFREISARYLAAFTTRRMEKWKSDAAEKQLKILTNLIHAASGTQFGKDHDFSEITDYPSFREKVPVKDYEGIKPYIEQAIAGEANILWPGKPRYFCKSSGTTSGTKYIPISRESMPNHIRSARNSLLNYLHETNKLALVNRKMIFIQGSPELEQVNGIPTGRLSGIVAHHVPKYLQKNRLPSYSTNCIKDWEEKINAIVEETIEQDMGLIGGIPPWLQMYFERVLEKTGNKTIKETFPNLQLVVVGGVKFDPYEKRFRQLLGNGVDFLETYPASEGFIAYQDKQKESSLLLLLDENIFYEFIRAEDVFNENPERIFIKDVEIGVNYALVMSTNAGLWAYLIGDTIKFTSINPYKIIITGRIRHFISAFGEHVIAEEVESAISEISKTEQVDITEFTVAPRVNTTQGELPYHEWFIEFLHPPADLDSFRNKLDSLMCHKNIYYHDLVKGGVLQGLKVTLVPPGGFKELMKMQGKFGGQNKMVHLSNDRKIASILEKFLNAEQK